MTYGYARVSTMQQNEDRQVLAMIEMGNSIEQIYVDKASGSNFNRMSYQKLMLFASREH